MNLARFTGVRHTWLGFLRIWGAVSGGIAVVCLMLLAIVWAVGGLDTAGGHLDWTVVAALAGVGSAVATAGAIAALRFVLTELEAQARDERISRKPYLRIDVGFLEEDERSPGFTPSTSKYTFTADDFGLGSEVAKLKDLAPADGEEALTLTLWVTNQQTAPLGIAYDIRISLASGWPAEQGEEEIRSIDVKLTYVEPDTTTAIALCAIRKSIPMFVVGVAEATYQDIFGGEPLRERHGALEMLYDGARSEVLNDRSFRLER